MLDKYKKKKKPAGDQESHPRSRYTVRSDASQGPEPGEGLPVIGKIRDEENSKAEEERVAGSENHYESPPEKPEDGFRVPRPEIRSAIKSAMKSALPPSPLLFQKPSRRPEILQVSDLPDEPLMEDIENAEQYGESMETPETEDLVQPSDEQEFMDEDEEPDAELETALEKNPPYCKDCGKKVPPIANFCPGCGAPLGISFQPKDPKRQFLTEK